MHAIRSITSLSRRLALLSNHARALSDKSIKTKSDLPQPDSQQEKSELVESLKETRIEAQPYQEEDEQSMEPRKHVFQSITTLQNEDPVFTLEEAAQDCFTGTIKTYYKYPTLFDKANDRDYFLRGVDNEHTIVHQFPYLTDFLIVGSGLIGSATAYYLKKKVDRTADVLILDKDPYSSNVCSAVCNGLLSSQSKSSDIARIAALSKEFIRNLQTDLLCTPEDFAKINYRPCTHLNPIVRHKNGLSMVRQKLVYLQFATFPPELN